MNKKSRSRQLRLLIVFSTFVLAVASNSFVLHAAPPISVAATPAPGPDSAGVADITATALVLDVSGSMAEVWQGGVKIDSAKQAAIDIVSMMEQESQVGGVAHMVGLAPFSSIAWVDRSLTDDYAGVKDAIANLYPQEGTNMGAGIQAGNDVLSGTPPGVSRIMILLSDGLTNEGLVPADILAGPVVEAVNAGTCIYTVGFGDAGALDEQLLQEIAISSGCGEYYYATDSYQLNNIYIKIRHQSTGQILAEFEGQVRQDETTPPEPVQVPETQSDLYITLNWKGSALDLVVTDPRGRQVDESYPDARLVTYARFAYLIIRNPLPGLWQVAVFGRDVPEAILDYKALVSSRQGVEAARSLSGWLLPLVAIIALAALIVALVALLRGRGSLPTLKRKAAVLYVRHPDGNQQQVAIPGEGLTIGRDPRNGLSLPDILVSRSHAQIRRQREGYVLYDLRSTHGSFVNGQRVQVHLLRNGDEIRLGKTYLFLRSPS